jgi:hypothetical protein
MPRLGHGVLIFKENNMNAEQLLPIVLQAKSQGIEIVRIRGDSGYTEHTIYVDEALQWKEEFEKKLAIATYQIEQQRINSGINFGFKYTADGLADSAAHDFFMYLLNFNLLLRPADWPLPMELEKYPELLEHWNKGYKRTSDNMYSDPD